MDLSDPAVQVNVDHLFGDMRMEPSILPASLRAC
jgi:hypothetical protein